MVGPDARHIGVACMGECHYEGTRGIAERGTDVAEEQSVEIAQTLLVIRVARGFHFLEDKRMAAHGTLTEYHEAAGQDICAFHGNADGNRIIQHGRGSCSGPK